MRNLICLSVAFVAGVCFVGSFALAQDKPAGQDKPAAGGMDDAMMKAFMEAGTPGPQHKAMEPMAGKFKYTSKMRMDPSQEWMTSEGDYEGELAMEGRYLLTQVNGSMMGMQFMGMGCLAYDNMLKKWVSAWIDSMSTGIMRSEGTSDAAMKVITFEGEMLDPMTKQMTKYKYAFEVKSNDEFAMRMWSPNPADGKMFESMVINYTREK